MKDAFWQANSRVKMGRFQMAEDAEESIFIIACKLFPTWAKISWTSIIKWVTSFVS